jgi:hypothetical protein
VEWLKVKAPDFKPQYHKKKKKKKKERKRERVSSVPKTPEMGG